MITQSFNEKKKKLLIRIKDNITSYKVRNIIHYKIKYIFLSDTEGE